MKPLAPAVAALLGLLLGYLLWHGATDPQIQAALDRAERAEHLAAQNWETAQRLAGDAVTFQRRADSLSRLAQVPRARGRHTVDTVLVRLSQGDSVGAVASLLGAFQACEEAGRLDSLALGACRASGAAKDSALTVLGVTVDSLRAANRGSIGVLRRVRPKPWGVGLLLSGATPVGGYLSRDILFGRVGLEVTDGPEEPTTVRISAGLRF